jgi:hypothetical protein
MSARTERVADVLVGAVVASTALYGPILLGEHAPLVLGWFAEDVRGPLLVIAIAVALRVGRALGQRRPPVEVVLCAVRMLAGAYAGWIATLFLVFAWLA